MSSILTSLGPESQSLLDNYFTKAEVTNQLTKTTYTKAEVRQLIADAVANILTEGGIRIPIENDTAHVGTAKFVQNSDGDLILRLTGVVEVD